MKTPERIVAFAFAFAVCLGGCSQQASEGGTNTNWIACKTKDDCPTRFDCVEERCVASEADAAAGSVADARAGSGGRSDGAGIRDAEVSECAESAPYDPSTGDCSVPAVPDPPPYCVAPCVWEAVKRCLPLSGNCVRQAVPSPYGGHLDAFCQPSTAWISTAGQSSGFGRGSHTLLTVETSKGLCYSGAAWQMSFGVLVRYLGAHATQVGDGPVFCAAAGELGGYTPGSTDFPEGVDYYYLDRSRPECGAWDEWGFPKEPCVATPGQCVPSITGPGNADGGK